MRLRIFRAIAHARICRVIALIAMTGVVAAAGCSILADSAFDESKIPPDDAGDAGDDHGSSDSFAAETVPDTLVAIDVFEDFAEAADTTLVPDAAPDTAMA